MWLVSPPKTPIKQNMQHDGKETESGVKTPCKNRQREGDTAGRVDEGESEREVAHGTGKHAEEEEERIFFSALYFLFTALVWSPGDFISRIRLITKVWNS